jgi:hypothetical protein
MTPAAERRFHRDFVPPADRLGGQRVHQHSTTFATIDFGPHQIVSNGMVEQDNIELVHNPQPSWHTRQGE